MSLVEQIAIANQNFDESMYILVRKHSQKYVEIAKCLANLSEALNGMEDKKREQLMAITADIFANFSLYTSIPCETLMSLATTILDLRRHRRTEIKIALGFGGMEADILIRQIKARMK